jgi:hypothetical protein
VRARKARNGDASSSDRALAKDCAQRHVAPEAQRASDGRASVKGTCSTSSCVRNCAGCCVASEVLARDGGGTVVTPADAPVTIGNGDGASWKAGSSPIP